MSEELEKTLRGQLAQRDTALKRLVDRNRSQRLRISGNMRRIAELEQQVGLLESRLGRTRHAVG